jgi:hypothetical protein
MLAEGGCVMDLTTLGIFLGFFLTGMVAGIPIGQAFEHRRLLTTARFDRRSSRKKRSTRSWRHARSHEHSGSHHRRRVRRVQTSETLSNDVERETFDQAWLRTQAKDLCFVCRELVDQADERRSLASFQRWSVSTEPRRLFPMVETGLLEFPCSICDDLGLWLTPKGDVQPCPVIARRDRHREPNAAAAVFSVRSMSSNAAMSASTLGFSRW